MAASRKRSKKNKKNNRSGCAFWLIPLALGLIILFANTDVLNYLKKFLRGSADKSSRSQNNKQTQHGTQQNTQHNNRDITSIIHRDMRRTTRQNLNKMERQIRRSSSSSSRSSSSSKARTTQSKEYFTATIYFIKYNKSSDTFQLIPVSRKIKKSDSPALSVIHALLAGPTTRELQRGMRTLIARGTKIRSMRVKRKILYIDLSSHFIYNQKIGREGMVLQIYQIVNSMTRFPTVRGVRFLINGKTVQSAGGDGIILNKVFYYKSRPLR